MIMGYTLPNAEELIKSGRKIHTFRKDHAQRWQVGRPIEHAEVAPNKQRIFATGRVTARQQTLLVLLIDKKTGEHTLKATIDRRRLSQAEVQELIRADGFDSQADFEAWFFKDGTTLWGGTLIHWTDKKY